jgi:CHAT domain-containing protein
VTASMRDIEAVGTFAALPEAAQSEYLGSRPELVQAANVARLIEAAREQLHVDRQRSLALAAAAEVIARRLDDPRLMGLSLRAQGNALWASGSHALSVDRHTRALRLFESARDEVEAARTLNALINPLNLLGRYDDALRAGARAREIFAAVGDEVRLARLDINLGNVLHRQDRFDEALDAYERAGDRVRALGDVDGIISALHNKAVTLTSLTRFPEALATYEAARALSVQHAMPLKVAQTDYNVAWLFYLRGEYARAIDLLRATAQTSDREGDRYHAALCRLDLSEVYLELGLNEEARDLAEHARALFRDIGSGYEAAKALTNAAIAEGREGSADRALTMLETARARFVEEQNHVWPSLIDLYRAVLLLQEGRLHESLRFAETALAFFARTSLKTKAAACHLLRARATLRIGQLDAAREACDRAATELEGLETPALTYEAHMVAGQVRAARGDRAGAYEAYDRARLDVELLRGRLQGDEMKIAFGQNKLELYENLVALSLEAADVDPRRLEAAFNHVEQAKCRSLLDLIGRAPGATAGADTEAPAASRVGRLREELNWYYHLAEREALQPGEMDPEKLRHLQDKLSAREKELARLLRERPGESFSPGSATATLEEIQDALPPDAVLLEFIQVHDRIVLWVVGRNSLQVVQLGSVAAAQERVRWLQYQIEKVRLGPEYARTFEPLLLESVRSHLYALHAALLGPVWNGIKGRHLIVVPHGFLHYVPYHALFDGQQYVIDRCTVSYAPSASVFARGCARSSAERATGDPLVLGVADERAPFIEAEAREVAAVLPSATLFLGGDATTEVLRSRGRSSPVVHIASHGRFRPDSPMFSAIRLADGYLTGNDLARLTLPAALVTLSGCATGQAVAAAGDEILGISRGLFAAGARSLLLSLWDVHDESTTTFMTSFYRTLTAAGNLAEAVQEATVQVKTRYPHPYYWAPFMLIGQFRGC